MLSYRGLNAKLRLIAQGCFPSAGHAKANGYAVMTIERKEYPEDHWLRSDDVQKALAVYMDQQGKAYSRVKNAFIRELLGELRGLRFMDYGCGAGMFVVHAAREGALEVVGVDAVPTALDTARYFARTEGLERLCTFINNDGFPEMTSRPRFDVILMKDVIEHVPDDQGLLNAAAGALAPGGSLILSTQNSMSLNFLIQGTFHRVIRGDKNWFGWDDTHLRFYTPMSLQTKLRKAGFEIEGWRSVYLVPYKFPNLPGAGKKYIRFDSMSWIDSTLGWIFPYNRLGWNVIVKARSSSLVQERTRQSAPITGTVAAAPLVLTFGLP